MPTYIIFANSDDGFLSSNASTYAACQSGTALTLDNTSTFFNVGQYLDTGPTYRQYEAFLNFDTSSVPTSEHGIACMLQLTMVANHGITGDRTTAPGNDLDARFVSWTSPLTTAQWKTAQGTIAAGQQIGAQYGNNFRAQSRVLMSTLGNWSGITAGGATRVVVSSGHAIAASPPTGLEYATFDSSNIGTNNDPTLIYTTVKRDTMRLVNKCSSQLSTGQIVSILSDGADPVPGLLLGYYTKGTATFNVIATLSVGSTGASEFTSFGGNNVMDLVVDASDNIYVIGANGNSQAWWEAKAFAKGAGLSWTAKTALLTPMNADRNRLQSLAAAFVNATTGHGWIYAVAHPEYESWSNPTANVSADSPYIKLDCGALLAGSGTLSDGGQTLAFYGAGPSYSFDGGIRLVDTIPFSNGIVATAALTCTAWASKASASAAVQIAWNVTSWDAITKTGTNVRADNKAGTITSPNSGSTSFGGDSQIKCVQLDGSKVAIVYGPSSTYHGVVIVDSHGNGTAYTAINTNTMPDFSTTSDWDASYDPSSGTLWLYYIDITNNRRLARVPFGVVSGNWSNTETQVSTTLGSAGGTNSKLRATPITGTNLNLVVECASVTSGGAWSVTALTDNFSNPPNAPAVNYIAPYDATTAKVVSWLFSDPDVGDSQSAYAIEIDNNGTGASAYRSGTVTSTSQTATISAGTLSNGVTYRLRVSNKDSLGTQGPFSAYTIFSTSAAGSVTITDPATDNPANQDVSSYTVIWTFTGSGVTQTKYQIKMIRLLDGVTLYDSGLVTSTATSAVIPAIPSDTPVRFDLVITNSGTLTTPVSSRLYTTSYLSPDQITTVNAVSSIDSVTVTWAIPTPTGSRPAGSSYDVFRSIDMGATWTGIINLPAGSTSYVDNVVPSLNTPMYVVRANATTGYTWSVSATASAAIAFYGVIINQLGPTSAPWGTSQALFFGGANNVETVTPGSTSLSFAGRTNPAIEFGDNQDDSVAVQAIVPFQGNPIASLDDTNYLSSQQVVAAMQAIVDAHDTVCFRDGRGRQVFGAITSFTNTDTDIGTQLQFTVTAVDFAEGEMTTNVTT